MHSKLSNSPFGDWENYIRKIISGSFNFTAHGYFTSLAQNCKK